VWSCSCRVFVCDLFLLLLLTMHLPLSMYCSARGPPRYHSDLRWHTHSPRVYFGPLCCTAWAQGTPTVQLLTTNPPHVSFFAQLEAPLDILLISVGILVLLVSILGLCAALHEHRALLQCYATLLLSSAAGIVGLCAYVFAEGLNALQGWLDQLGQGLADAGLVSARQI